MVREYGGTSLLMSVAGKQGRAGTRLSTLHRHVPSDLLSPISKDPTSEISTTPSISFEPMIQIFS